MAKGLRELTGVVPSKPVIKESVLVIIDAQNEYADGLLHTSDVSSTRKAIATLLHRYRAEKSTIVHIVHDTPEGAPIFTPSTSLAKIFEELEPQLEEEVLHKSHPGSFTGTKLDDYLKGTGKTQLVLVGYMAHVCVSTTARQAAEKGYDVILPRGAIGDRDIPGAKAEEVVDVVLKELGDAFGTVVDVGDILAGSD